MSETEVLHKVNVRDLSIRCAVCGRYQTLTDFEACDGYNAYTYECEDSPCEPAATRTLVEVPSVLDVFYQKPPECGGTGD